MGKITAPRLVKLIVGMLSSHPEIFPQVDSLLSVEFGSLDYISELLPFTHTEYYEEEMGGNLKRRFVSFERLAEPGSLSNVKCFTNRVESRFAVEGKRRVNLDPGYIAASKLVLASTKDYYHRIYLDKGIYAEVTLHYQKGGFLPFPWTYPDYKSEEYRRIFNKIRNLYLKQLKEIS